MDNEFVESATRTVLTMAATMLLHQSGVSEDLHELLQKASNALSDEITEREFSCAFPTASMNKTETSRYQPLTDTGIDQLVESRTMHFPETPFSVHPMSSMYQRQPLDTLAELEESKTIHFDDTRDTLACVNDGAGPDECISDRFHEEIDRSLDQSEPSYRLTRPSRPVQRRAQRETPDLYRSYVAPMPTSTSCTPKFAVGPPSAPPGIHRKRHLKRIISKQQPEASSAKPLTSETDGSFRISRAPRAPIYHDRYARIHPDRSYVSTNVAPETYFTPRELPPMSPAMDLDSVSLPDDTLFSFTSSQAVPNSAGSYRIARPDGSVKRRGKSVEPGLYRSHAENPSPRPDQVMPPHSYTPGDEESFEIYRRHGNMRRLGRRQSDTDLYRSFENVDPTTQASARSHPGVPTMIYPSKSTPAGHQQFGFTEKNLTSAREPTFLDVPSSTMFGKSMDQSRQNDPDNQISMHFPNLSRRPPNINFSTHERSKSKAESGFVSGQSLTENLEEIEADFAPDLNSTLFSKAEHGLTDIDETVCKLLDRICYQVDKIRLEGTSADRDRIGILRRNSNDYDFSTGRMRQ
ncbi:uncharacterized protein LOC131440295 [Malaya genurostris]|uniref:uncharacterized protein LOC131440295 n=1 Tax=Malaya genurostris TaxID=325434 RepID=UPI0026F3FE72|nr:uncharacterized protein LOC131440295 [Malaya genurostris]